MEVFNLKKFILGLLIISVLVLSACSSSNDGEKDKTENKETQNTNENSESDSESKEEGQAVGVDKGLFSVEVTLPPSFFEGEGIDQAIADAKEEGIKEATKNSDGSVTYKMSKDKHKEMMEEIEVGLKEYLEELKTSEEYPSIKNVTANKEYSEYTLVVNKEGYENGFEGFATLGLGMMGIYYQIFDGVDSDDAIVEVHIKDETTDEIFDTVVFPDDMGE